MDLFTEDYFRKTGKQWKNTLGIKALFLPVDLKFLYHFRKSQIRKKTFSYHWMIQTLIRRRLGLDIYPEMEIGGGLYLGHPWGITINPEARMGRNINIHKGVTIGKENRGARKGAPMIRDFVWIGMNATIVGNIEIGTDVMIAANAFVNRTVPAHSVVIGNPCIIIPKENATLGYINLVRPIPN